MASHILRSETLEIGKVVCSARASLIQLIELNMVLNKHYIL